MQTPPYLKLQSVTVAMQTPGAPILPHRQPTAALAGEPESIAAPISSPARMTILRMGISLLEKTRHYATGTSKYQAMCGLAGVTRRVLNQIYCCSAVSGDFIGARTSPKRLRRLHGPGRPQSSRTGPDQPIQLPGIRPPAAGRPRPKT